MNENKKIAEKIANTVQGHSIDTCRWQGLVYAIREALDSKDTIHPLKLPIYKIEWTNIMGVEFGLIGYQWKTLVRAVEDTMKKDELRHAKK